MTRNNPQRRVDPESAPQDPRMVAVRGILIRLRKRSGLNPGRLASTEIDTTTLLQLSVVRRYAHLSGITTAAALPKVIAHLARRLPPTQQLIVDAELGLGLLREHPPAGLDLGQLYGPDLGRRRVYLAQHWRQLHAALSVAEAPAAPTARSLRDAPETQAFTALAELLTSTSDLDIAGVSLLCAVTVVGDVATDQINVVEKFPEPGESIWGDFRRHPGGKGLNRAVALARLGLDVRLLATIGEDTDGQLIRDYLEREGVDTSLLRTTSRGHTPVATVILPLRGKSVTIAFRENRLQLSESDLDSNPVRQAIASSAAVLVTFEQPIDIVAQVFAMVDKLPNRPRLIVNVSPPTVLPRHLHEHLRAVDYLIGTSNEVAATWPECSVEESTQRLLHCGVGAVCTVDSAGCTIFTARGQTNLPRVNSAMAASAGASSVFSAALVYRLLENRRLADEADFRWAAAAMSARRPVLNIPDSMPSVAGIDEVVANGNLNGDIVIRRV